MNCPHCAKTLPKIYSAKCCPFCGEDLSPTSSDGSNGLISTRKFRWIFLSVLLAPVLLTALASQLLSYRSPTTTAIAFMGGGISGIVCGVLSGRRFGISRGQKIALGFVFAVVMIIVSIAMNFFGCMIGGYKLDLR